MTRRQPVLFLAMASPKQLHDDISKGKFRPVYYFYGSEDYRRSEAEKFVADHFLPDMQRSINYHKIDSKKTSAAELAAALSNLPMLGERQVFVVGNFESYKAKDTERLLPYIKSKDPNRVIILSTSSAKTPKKNSPLFKSVSEYAETIEFKKLTLEDSRIQIDSRLGKYKIAIEGEARDLLIGLVDGDRGGLESELNKLTNYKESGETITVDDIRNVSSGYQLFDVFELGDVIIDGNAKKTFQMVQTLLGAGASVDNLIVLLLQHFLSVYLVKNGRPAVGNRNFPFLLAKFRQQAKGFTNNRLEQMLIDLAQANTEVRHQRLPAELVLETLTFKLSSRN